MREVDLGIEVAEFAGLDQRGDNCPRRCRRNRRRVLAIEGIGSDRPFDDVGVHVDAAVVKEAGEPSHRERCQLVATPVVNG